VRLDQLAREGDPAWSRVEAMIDTRKPAEYDAAVTLLTDLRAPAEREHRYDTFTLRTTALRQTNARKQPHRTPQSGRHLNTRSTVGSVTDHPSLPGPFVDLRPLRCRRCWTPGRAHRRQASTKQTLASRLRICILVGMTTMLRVSERTRDRVMQVAAADFGGATAEETLNRLLDEHWEAQAIAAMDRFRASDPEGWLEYLAEAGRWDEAQTSVVDTWDEQGPA